jgi:drug/metabolite transporter (DMT)-like permease
LEEIGGGIKNLDNWFWIPLTLMAVTMQTIRTAGQKHLTSHLDSIVVTLVRFLFGLPFAVIYLITLFILDGRGFPSITISFFIYTIVAVLTQIIGTALMIYMFSLRNFAVGTTYARTDTFLTALVGTLIFSESIKLTGWIAIATCIVGVILITVGSTSLPENTLPFFILQPSAYIGLTSGFCNAIASLCLRYASLSFGDPNFLFTAAFTLVSVLFIQTILLSVYILIKKREQFITMTHQWKTSTLVGITSMIGSVGWFTAMTIQRASYVKALGQIEFVLAFVVSTLFFRERSTIKELLGMSLIATGILILLYFA